MSDLRTYVAHGSDTKSFDESVGERVRELRVRHGLKQEQLATALEIPRSAVSMIESGSRSLASSELARLSRIYGWSAEVLLFGNSDHEESEHEQDHEPVLRFFRSQAALEPGEEHWLAEAEQLWYRYAQLERRLHGEQRWDLPTYPVPSGRPYEQGERLAEQERRRLDLGAAPVRSMIGLLEGEGVKVLLRPLGKDSDVSGAYFFSRDLGPCVLVNSDDQYSRRRFTEAHEYCHFLVDRQPLEGEICSMHRRREAFEMRANAFAAAFLMPAQGVREALAEADLLEGTVDPEDVVNLMFRFGVSYQAILWRLVNLRCISTNDRERLARHSPHDVARRLGYLHEPGETEAAPDRFRRLAVDAWRTSEISSQELAELFQIAASDVEPLFGAQNAGHPTRRAAKKPVEEPDWL